jgi:hypothetical protein
MHRNVELYIMSDIYRMLLWGTNKYYKEGNIVKPAKSISLWLQHIVRLFKFDQPVPNCLRESICV